MTFRPVDYLSSLPTTRKSCILRADPVQSTTTDHVIATTERTGSNEVPCKNQDNPISLTSATFGAERYQNHLLVTTHTIMVTSEPNGTVMTRAKKSENN